MTNNKLIKLSRLANKSYTR